VFDVLDRAGTIVSRNSWIAQHSSDGVTAINE
jgi:hypothetical protein